MFLASLALISYGFYVVHPALGYMASGVCLLILCVLLVVNRVREHAIEELEKYDRGVH